MTVRTKDANKGHAVEAFRRCKFKFAGQQKIVVSNNWGFTRFKREKYEELKAAGKLIFKGDDAKEVSVHGPLDKVTHK